MHVKVANVHEMQVKMGAIWLIFLSQLLLLCSPLRMCVNHEAAKIFAGVKFTPPLSTYLDTLGLHNPTPIQAAAIAPLTSGITAILHAETGSGKTLAYLLPLLKRLNDPSHIIKPLQAVILVPTKELAVQVAADITALHAGSQDMVHLCITSEPDDGGKLQGLFYRFSSNRRSIKHSHPHCISFHFQSY